MSKRVKGKKRATVENVTEAKRVESRDCERARDPSVPATVKLRDMRPGEAMHHYRGVFPVPPAIYEGIVRACRAQRGDALVLVEIAPIQIVEVVVVRTLTNIDPLPVPGT